MTDTQPDLIAVVAMVNLEGLRRGEEALVDPENANVAAWLNAQYLVPLPADQQPLGNRR